MNFEWDEYKEYENFIKHGVLFSTAEQIFNDPLRIERPDINSEWECRWQTIGIDEDMLFVVYTERGENTRIISARLAEPFERRIYYGDCETRGWFRVNP
jgi:uncharacterized DUF497 family protein